MLRRGPGLLFGLGAVALLGAAAPASVAAGSPPAKVEVGRVGLSTPQQGRAELLVAVHYPIQLARRPLPISVSLERPGHGPVYTWELRPTANAGAARLPERRRGFTFVHGIELTAAQTRLARRGFRTGGEKRRWLRPAVAVSADGRLDVNGDGVAELSSRDRETQRLPRAASRPLCASLPRLRTRPGRTLSVPLPRCGTRVRWRLAARPAGGRGRIRDGRLVFRPGRRFRGTAAVELAAAARVASASAAPLTTTLQVQVLDEGSEGAVVRAMGDSVTAGFGYYDDGSAMPFEELLNCRPGEGEYDDACSSNSAVRTDKKGTKLEYAPDYGLANNVSWAAQWANEYGVDNYANFAVSGSEPKDWAPGGQLYATTQRIESEAPDYILMTVGANPLLSEVLFGVDNMGCAIWSQIVGGFSECVEKAFEGVHLKANLTRLYRELVQKTDAVVYLMQYPLTVPSSALAYSSTQIAEMGALLNREIAAAAAAVNPGRLRPVAPPHFNVGIDVSPVYPSRFTCSYLEYMVDGPSVQSEPTQDELLVDHPLSFCEGPAGGEPPWVISGDTGIHPSATGYAQMASRLPPP